MAPSKDLETEQIEVLHEWLKSMGMPISRQFSRDYADGVMVAKLLKSLYPRYIDLHSYQARFSQELKVVNWQMLHFKILSKIGLPLNREMMATLAKGDTNAIQRLLWAIMNTVQQYPKDEKNSLGAEKSQIMRKSSATAALKTKKSQVVVVPGTQKLSSILKPPENVSSTTFDVVNKPSKIVDIIEEAMIPYAMYEGAINEIHTKEKTIKKYETKVAFLENLIKEKDTEIEGLKKKSSEGLLVI